jgi:hypothetical protein
MLANDEAATQLVHGSRPSTMVARPHGKYLMLAVYETAPVLSTMCYCVHHHVLIAYCRRQTQIGIIFHHYGSHSNGTACRGAFKDLLDQFLR